MGNQFKEWMIGSRSIIWLHGIRESLELQKYRDCQLRRIYSWLWKDHSLVSQVFVSDSTRLTDSSSTTIEAVIRSYANEASVAIAYYYFDFSDQEKQSARNCLSSLIGQLCRQRVEIPERVALFYDQHVKYHQLPTIKDLVKCLEAAAEGLRVYIIADALDECAERGKMLSILSDITAGKLGSIFTLITSRREADIDAVLNPLSSGGICVQGAQVDADIRVHVRSCIRQESLLDRWSESVNIEEALVNGAQGM